MIQEEGILLIVISKLKIKILRSSLCYYADAYILVKGRIKITGEGDDAA